MGGLVGALALYQLCQHNWWHSWPSLFPPPCTGALPLGTLPSPAQLVGVGLTGLSSGNTLCPTSAIPQPLTHSPPLTLEPGSGLSQLAQPGPNGDMSLSMSSRPIPAKIVELVRSGRYVEMRDFLDNNVAVRRHFEEAHGVMGIQLLPVSSRPRIREVTTLPVWLSCFLAYLAVGTADPVTHDKLAYAILINQEAMRHGRQGWLEYKRLSGSKQP